MTFNVKAWYYDKDMVFHKMLHENVSRTEAQHLMEETSALYNRLLNRGEIKDYQVETFCTK